MAKNTPLLPAAAQVRVQTLGNQLIARIAERYVSGVARSAPVRNQHQLDERRLRRVLEYIAQQIEDEISLADLAAVACLSPFHFSRMFTRRMGMPPHRYIGRMRLERAKTLLALGRVGLAEISAACCFSSQSNFSRAFRRATGTSPLEFRRRSG